MDWHTHQREEVTLYPLSRRLLWSNIAVSTEMGSLPRALEEHDDIKIGFMHNMFRLNVHALWYFSLRSRNQGKQL